MAKILSNSGIVDGSPVLSGHVTQSINALTGAEAYEITISGSLEVTGSSNLLGDKTINGDLTVTDQANIQTGFTASGLIYPDSDGMSGSVLSTDSNGNLSFVTSLAGVTVASASYVVSSSYAAHAASVDTASHANTAGSADTASLALSVTSASYASTASFIDLDELNYTASQLVGTGSGIFSGSFSGSFQGDGSDLTNIQTSSYALTASYVVGLNVSGAVNSSSYATTSSRVVGGGSGSFEGNFTGNGSGLTDLAAPGAQANVLFNNGGEISATSIINVATGSVGVQIGANILPTAPLDVFGRIAQRGLRNTIVIGEQAYQNDLTGCQNIAIGRCAISGSSGTECSVAIGFRALATDNATSNNVAIGNTALNNASGDNNVAVGSNVANQIASGDCNVGVGNCSLEFLGTGNENVGVGYRALAQIRSGSNNVALGSDAGYNSIGNSQNVFVGRAAGLEVQVGNQNTLIGAHAGECLNGASTGNVIIGFCAGPITLQEYTNKLYISNEQHNEPLISGDFGSNATLNINGTLTASGLNYPAADATSGSVLTTDGNGQLVFKPAAAFQTDAAVVDTSSFYHSSSISASVITFNQATTTETVNLPETSSYALMALTASYAVSASVEVQTEVSSSHAQNADTASHAIFAITASHALNSNSVDGAISSSEQISELGFVTSSATASFLTGADTASFVTNSQTGSFLTGADTASFVVNSQTSSFLTGADTASFVTNSQTSSFLTGADTASFITNDDTASFVTNSQTSSFLTSDDTGSFLDNDDTGSFFTGSTVSDATLTFHLGNATTEIRTIDNVTSSATASYVQGTNVDGAVTSATSASYIQGSNVDGAVTNATSASYILGSNVSGTVNSASHALISNTASFALTASYALNAGSAGVDASVTGSSLITASISGSGQNFIEFEKGNGDTFALQIDQSVVNGNSYVHNQTVSSSTWNVAHNIGTSFPAVTVFNDQGEVVLPQNIEIVDANNITVTFPVNTTGDVSVTTGGGHVPINTGSFYISSSVNLNTITFTQGDGTTDQLTVNTGSGGGSNVTIGNDGNDRVVTANGDGTLSGSTDFTFDGTYAQAPNHRATTGFLLRTPENLNGRRGILIGDQTDTRRGGIDYHINNRTISLNANSADGTLHDNSSRLEIDGTNQRATFISASLTVSGSTDISGSLSISGISDVSASIATLEATNDTGSLLVTASLSGSSLNVIEFEKGNGDKFNVEINSELPVTQSFTNTNTFDIVHSFSSKAVVVAVYDNNDEQIIPSNVAIVDNSTVRVTFTSNYSGYGVVTKGGITGGGNVNTHTQTFGPATQVVASHNFDQRLVLVQVYDEDFRQLIPQDITLTDANSVTIDFSSPQSGSIIIKR